MITKKDIQNIYSLSPMQEGILFHARFQDNPAAYFEQLVLRLKTKEEPERIEKTFNLLIEKHDVLRTIFTYKKVKVPKQILLKKRKMDLRVEDVSHLSPHEAEAFLEQFRQDDIRKGFDLTKGPLMRATLVHVSDNSSVLVWSYHHILMDGWCFQILSRDFMMTQQKLVMGLPPDSTPAVPYSRYITWLGKQDKQKGLRLWKNYLEGYEEVSYFPRQKQPPSGDFGQNRVREISHRVGQAVTEKLTASARSHGVTLNSMFQTLWGLVLQRYNDCDDVVFGAVVSGRPPHLEGAVNILGLFINTVPVRIKCSRKQSFSSLVKEVQKSVGELRSHEYLPLAEIQAESGAAGGLFDHIIAFENYNLQAPTEKSAPEEPYFSIASTRHYEQTHYPFTIIVFPKTSSLEIKFTYDTAIYEEAFIRRAGEYLERLMEQVTSTPLIASGAVDILSDSEKQQLLRDFNRRDLFPSSFTLDRLFERQVEKTPNALALTFTGSGSRLEEQLTYLELNRRAGVLARELSKVGGGMFIGLLTEPSIDMVVGLLGILKAGCAYVPLNPHAPVARNSFMLKECNAQLLLTNLSPAPALSFDGQTIHFQNLPLYPPPGQLPGQELATESTGQASSAAYV
ncbi:MAG: AMP-binding protein, partial [bacterium]|nr:AMP-binding protein [bacterium]